MAGGEVGAKSGREAWEREVLDDSGRGGEMSCRVAPRSQTFLRPRKVAFP